ncbi:MAG: hypothetical protein EON60_12150 [Alphaproteobacteria bacterium]|nr:MAG: hypothetical protein EON60_12150 [Alphaproteobacteria bacterium]
MTKTVLNYTYTGELTITIDSNAPPNLKLSTMLKSRIEGDQKGFPEGAEEEIAVQTYREKQLDFKDDPLGYFLFLYHAGTPTNADPLKRQRDMLNHLHRVKSEAPPLPRWKRWVIEMLGLAHAH